MFYLFVLIQTPDDMIYETNEKLSELANKYRRFFFFTKFCFAFKIVSRKEDKKKTQLKRQENQFEYLK